MTPPLVKTLLLCQEAQQHPTTKRYTLTGIFHRLEVTGFPCLIPPMTVYVSLTDLQGIPGAHRLVLRLVELDSGAVIAISEGTITGTGTQPGDIVEMTRIIPLSARPVAFKRPGVYAVQLLIDGDLLGDVHFGVVGPSTKFSRD